MSEPADESAIQTILDDSYRAWAAGDAAGMVADYTADATAIMPGSLRDGRDAIRESMAQAFAGPLKDTSTTAGSSACASWAPHRYRRQRVRVLFPGRPRFPTRAR